MSYSIAIKRGEEYLKIPNPHTEGGTTILFHRRGSKQAPATGERVD